MYTLFRKLFEKKCISMLMQNIPVNAWALRTPYFAEKKGSSLADRGSSGRQACNLVLQKLCKGRQWYNQNGRKFGVKQ